MFLRGLCGHVWVNILTLSPSCLRIQNRPVKKCNCTCCTSKNNSGAFWVLAHLSTTVIALRPWRWPEDKLGLHLDNRSDLPLDFLKPLLTYSLQRSLPNRPLTYSLQRSLSNRPLPYSLQRRVSPIDPLTYSLHRSLSNSPLTYSLHRSLSNRPLTYSLHRSLSNRPLPYSLHRRVSPIDPSRTHYRGVSPIDSSLTHYTGVSQ